MEEVIKAELGVATISPLGALGGGCINQARGYVTDQGKVFVKENSAKGARLMFDGEYESLKALHEANIVKVPKPIKVIDRPGGGALLVTEFLEIKGGLSKYSAQLGEQLARLHIQNEITGQAIAKTEASVHRNTELKYVKQFGFPVPTSCGFISQENIWDDDWVSFYAKKLEGQIRKVEEETPVYMFSKNNQYLVDPPRTRMTHATHLFSGQQHPLSVQSCLQRIYVQRQLSTRWRQLCTLIGLIFDPASFYGHSEYDLAIARMFGGFSPKFYDSYFSVIPKAPGYQKRLNLYKFFHYINHWNHFGDGYKSSSIQTLKSVLL